MSSGKLAELQLRLKEVMRGKKVLVVVDDILWSAFTCADNRSRVIVTTRSENVASVVKTGEVTYELQQPSDADCWKIFAVHMPLMESWMQIQVCNELVCRLLKSAVASH